MAEKLARKENHIMVVREFLEQNPSNKVWLCPDESSSCSIAPVKYECAMTYEKVNKIPVEILNSDVVKTWIEKDGEYEDYRCIIWKNFRNK